MDGKPRLPDKSPLKSAAVEFPIGPSIAEVLCYLGIGIIFGIMFGLAAKGLVGA